MPSGKAKSARIRREPIAGAADRANQLVVAERRQRFAETANVHVDRALLDIDVAAPDAVEELRAAVNAIGMQHDKLEQAKFGRTEHHFRLAHFDFVARGIEAELPALDYFVLSGGGAAGRGTDFCPAIPP